MRAAIFIGVAASLLLLACPGAPPPGPPKPLSVVETPTPLEPPRADGRLPAFAIPRGYALELDVDPRQQVFTGVVRIEVDIPAKTSWIVLHGRDITVRSARAVMDRAEPVNAQVTTRLAAGGNVPEELVLGFPRPIGGRATLVLEYGAAFQPDLAGLYRVDEDQSSYVFSQFEATDARRAFPCFDEPAFKVPFDVSVVVPNGMTAVTNTPETMREPVPGAAKTRFRFARTQPLPTYLVAFAVGDLQFAETSRSTKPPIRIITTKKSANTAQNKLALDVTGELVDRLATWFGIPYPYEKLDIVAVPQLSAGAMENPGLLTFRDNILLVDPARGSTRDRRDQALVIAHELAHQWFGDLVTAQWWSDLWLNEGMATWMETRIVDAWKPDWAVGVDAVADSHDVMDTDGLMSARAVRQPAVTKGDIESAFDGITYQKGAAILSTLEHWVGPDVFKRAVHDYLVANANKSVGTVKLFEALDRASGKDVSGLASGYLDQPGVPEIVAGVLCDQGGRWHVELGSRPWKPVGSSQTDDDPRFWNVPVCILTEGTKAEQCTDLIGGAPAVIGGKGVCPKWVHPNAGLAYYRWSVPPKSYAAMANAPRELDVSQRLSLLSNAWSSVRSGDLDAKYLLDVLPAFDSETARPTAVQAVSILRAMSDTVVEEDARPAFRKFALARLTKRKKIDDPLLRRSVTYAMADVAEDDATIRDADEVARKWLQDPASVDPDSASLMVDIASRKAGDERIEALLSALKKANNPQDRHVALHALAGFNDPARLEHALDRTLTNDVERTDVMSVVGPAMYRRAARATAEAWLQKHWDDVRKKLGPNLAGGVVRSLGAGCTVKEADEIVSFYTPKVQDIAGADRSIKEALEEVNLCVALRRKTASSVSKAFATKK